MQQILVTDTLFVLPEHERQLRNAGFAVERLKKVAATESELIRALQGKVGYILGGTEQVTPKVIASTQGLRAIVHCGSAYETFIPGWRAALAKGIAIATVPDGHTHAVAEWMCAAALAMNRGLLDTSQAALPTKGLEDQSIGIIGFGHIGVRLAEMLQTSRIQRLLYASAHRHSELESRLHLTFGTVSEVLHKSDIVFLCVSGSVGADFFGRIELGQMKPDTLLVSCMVPGVINANDLFQALDTKKIRAISDYPMDVRFRNLPAGYWYSNRISSAFNTFAGLRETSDAAVQSLLSLLLNGDDPARVYDTEVDNLSVSNSPTRRE